MGYRYHVKSGTPCQVAKPGRTLLDHVTQYDGAAPGFPHQVFEEDELSASRGKVPSDNPAAAHWGRRGYYVFFRAGSSWYLIVDSIYVDIEY